MSTSQFSKPAWDGAVKIEPNNDINKSWDDPLIVQKSAVIPVVVHFMALLNLADLNVHGMPTPAAHDHSMLYFIHILRLSLLRQHHHFKRDQILLSTPILSCLHSSLNSLHSNIYMFVFIILYRCDL